jgi:hypothetical protein
MRRTCLILLLAALLVPGASFALPSGQGGGSLAVTGANGSLVVQGHGVIFGHFVAGSLLVLGYRPDDPDDTLSVAGATSRSDSGVTTYTGTNVRFLLPAGRYTLELIATGIDISAVGRGTAGASSGQGTANGSFALDGGRPLPFARVVGPQTFGGKGL